MAEICLVALPLPDPGGAPQVIELVAEPSEPPPPPLADLGPSELTAQERLARDAADLSHLDQALADPRWQPIVDEQQLPPRDTESGDLVSAQVLREIARAQERTAEENLDELKQLTQRLNQVSSEPSVDQLAAGLKTLLGGTDRATAPAAEPVAGEFEIESAQLHDVRREKTADGGFRYIAVLVDARGRRSETELPGPEGKSAFDTFELMKANPLLERVYRGVVMSLLDNLAQPK